MSRELEHDRIVILLVAAISLMLFIAFMLVLQPQTWSELNIFNNPQNQTISCHITPNVSYMTCIRVWN